MYIYRLSCPFCRFSLLLPVLVSPEQEVREALQWRQQKKKKKKKKTVALPLSCFIQKRKKKKFSANMQINF